MQTIQAPTLGDIQAARQRLADCLVRTPLLPFTGEPGMAGIWLKPENLQPVGSFKIRGAGNALRQVPRARLEHGVYTVSVGNMAQGVAWHARDLGIHCSVLMPEQAPEVKAAAVRRLGAEVIRLPFERWWEIMLNPAYDGRPGFFLHPVCNTAVMAGNGTIGLEILDDLPDVDTVVIPFGGGGLSCGVACAMRALRPQVQIIACEVETAAPLRASLEAGAPATIPYTPSFVDGIGGPCVLDAMWPLVREHVNDSIVVSLAEVAACIRALVEEQHLVAEGAGGAALAAALSGRVPGDRIVCIISGGNIDPARLARLLAGAAP